MTATEKNNIINYAYKAIGATMLRHLDGLVITTYHPDIWYCIYVDDNDNVTIKEI